MKSAWHTGYVLHGKKEGQKIGFPTINFNSAILENSIKEGVYACYIKYDNIIYGGALYLGPRFSDEKPEKIIEIHIFNFNKNIYAEAVEFQLLQYIRPPLRLISLEMIKKQISKDIQIIKSILQEKRQVKENHS